MLSASTIRVPWRTLFLRNRPLPKQRSANPDISGAEGDGLFKIGAHTHAEIGKPVPLHQLFQQRKMRPRRLIDGRDAHQAAYSHTGFAAMIEQRRQAGRSYAALLFLLARVDLDETGQIATLLFHFFRQSIGQRRAVHGFNAIEQRHG
jgi:hypothetical protein